jgi:hypothetical protein
MKHYKNPITDELYAYEADGSQDAFIKEGLVAVTDAEVATIRAAKQQAAFNALTYAEKRAAAYPSIVDQLDTIYHKGIDAWKAEIAAVKTEHPKP